MEWGDNMLQLIAIGYQQAGYVEWGGATSTDGDAAVVTGSNGQKKPALIIYTSGDIVNDTHAIIPVVPGDYLIFVQHIQSGRYIVINRINRGFLCEMTEIEDNAAELTIHARVETIAKYEDGRWVTQPPDCLQEAIQVAIKKSETLNCTTPMWCLNVPKYTICKEKPSGPETFHAYI